MNVGGTKDLEPNKMRFINLTSHKSFQDLNTQKCLFGVLPYLPYFGFHCLRRKFLCILFMLTNFALKAEAFCAMELQLNSRRKKSFLFSLIRKEIYFKKSNYLCSI